MKIKNYSGSYPSFDSKVITDFISKSFLRKYGIEEQNYKEMLESLSSEAITFLGMKIHKDLELEEKEFNLLRSLYVQYSLFSKMENEEIAQDKMDLLIGTINSINSRYKKELEKNNSFLGIGVY